MDATFAGSVVEGWQAVSAACCVQQRKHKLEALQSKMKRGLRLDMSGVCSAVTQTHPDPEPPSKSDPWVPF